MAHTTQPNVTQLYRHCLLLSSMDWWAKLWIWHQWLNKRQRKPCCVRQRESNELRRRNARKTKKQCYVLRASTFRQIVSACIYYIHTIVIYDKWLICDKVECLKTLGGGVGAGGGVNINYLVRVWFTYLLPERGKRLTRARRAFAWHVSMAGMVIGCHHVFRGEQNTET